MESWQKDIETLTAYVHHFKTVAKWYAFDNDTLAIPNFVKGLWDVHATTAKIYKKDLQTLSEAIRLVEKWNAVQNLPAWWHPSWAAWCLMMIVALFVDVLPLLWCTMFKLWWIHSLFTRLPQQDPSPRNTMQLRQISFKVIIHPHPKGQITLHPLWAQTWETSPPITIMLQFPLGQEQQQLQKAHIALPI